MNIVKARTDSPENFYTWLDSNREKLIQLVMTNDGPKIIKELFPETKPLKSKLMSGLLKNSVIVGTSTKIKGDIVCPCEQELLVVLGDLDIEGNLIALGWDYSLIFVLGDLVAESVLSSGELFVCGKIQTSQAYLGVGNDYSTTANDLDCDLFLQSDHRTDFFGKRTVKKEYREFRFSEPAKNEIDKFLQNSSALSSVHEFYNDRGTEW